MRNLLYAGINEQNRDCVIKPVNVHRMAAVPTGRVISRDISLRHEYAGLINWQLFPGQRVTTDYQL